MDIPLGEHEMVFELDWGLLSDIRPLTNRFGGRPGQAEHWPKTLVRRVLTAKVPIRVVQPDFSPITLITDPARDPSAGGAISFTSIQVITGEKGLSLRPQYQPGRPAIPVCFRIRMKAGGKQCDLGWAGAHQGMSTSSGGGQIDSLPADLREAVVVLEPAPDIAEEHMTVDEIWGKVIVIERVPLDRYDLEDQATMGGETKPASR